MYTRTVYVRMMQHMFVCTHDRTTLSEELSSEPGKQMTAMENVETDANSSISQ